MQGTKNEWEPLRRRRRRVVIYSIFWAPMAALGAAMFWPHAGIPLEVASAAWALTFYSAAGTPCPRCSEAFGSRPITYFRDGSWSGSDKRPWDVQPNTYRGSGVTHSYWILNGNACVNCQLMAYGTFVREGGDAAEVPYEVPVPQSTVARFYAWCFPGTVAILWATHLRLALNPIAPVSEFTRICLGSMMLAGTLWTAGYASRVELIAGLRIGGWGILPIAIVVALLWQDRPDLALSCGVCTAAGWWAKGMAPIKS